MPAMAESAQPGRMLSKQDLVDYRAVQRTFDGAYARTALGQLCYAVAILRLFQDKFFFVGLAYSLLAVCFIPFAVYRYRNAVQNDDRYMELQGSPSGRKDQNEQAQRACAGATEVGGTEQAAGVEHPVAQIVQSQTVQPRLGLFVKSFVTAGSVVALATLMVGFFEVALLVLIFHV